MRTLAAIDAARAAIRLWPPDLAATMVAIAGAESGWRPDAGGDSPATLRYAGHYDSARIAATYNCPLGHDRGPASWGLWQIFMPYHRSKIATLGGPVDDPCRTAAWLRDPVNNARTADLVLRSEGLGAWTVYRTGTWTRYLDEARRAVDVALAERWAPPPAPLPWLPLLTGAVGVVALAYILVVSKRR